MAVADPLEKVLESSGDPLAHTYYTEKYQTRKKLIETKKKMFYMYIELTCKRKEQVCTHEDHDQLDDPLPFKIVYTSIVLVCFWCV